MTNKEECENEKEQIDSRRKWIKFGLEIYD